MSKNISISKLALGLSLATLGGISTVGFASAASTTVTRCSELESIVENATSGDTITLGLNCTKHITIASGQSLTLDLAGNQLYDYSENDVITVENGATLTLIDSVGGGIVKAGNPDYRTIVNEGTTSIKNLTVWGDIENSGSLNLESVTLDPEDYYPYPTYIINNDGGTLTTSGDSENNLFKSTPIYNNGGTVELTAATFNVAPDEDLIKEGYEVQEIDGKFVIVEKTEEPAENPQEEENNNSGEEENNNSSETPTDQTGDETEEPVEPLGETYTEAGTTTEAKTASPSVPNTGDRENAKETSSSSIDFLLLAFALGFTALLATVIIRSKKAAKEVIY